jgi:hypothetical protein
MVPVVNKAGEDVMPLGINHLVTLKPGRYGDNPVPLDADIRIHDFFGSNHRAILDNAIHVTLP